MSQVSRVAVGVALRCFPTIWRRLRAELTPLGEYNRMKSDRVGTPAYESSKSSFFDRVAGDQPPISPAKD